MTRFRARAPKRKKTNATNRVFGNEAERVAQARLAIACQAELKPSSREEDSSKIDLLLSMEHPWVPGERLLLPVQVKSGSSNGSLEPKGFRLDASVVSEVRRRTHPICVVWVADNGAGFWAYLAPGQRKGSRTYGQVHEISPTTPYDLARCHARFGPHSRGGQGVTMSGMGDLRIARRLAKVRYSGPGVDTPLLGEVELSRLGWRHMFRASRSRPRKQASLETLPQLRAILAQVPSAHWMTSHEHESVEGEHVRYAEYVLRYDRVQLQRAGGSERRPVFVRIAEEISYPSDWMASGALYGRVRRRVVLRSAYHKPK